MPKKLLTNNHPEQRIVPVTDGLICWYDGRDVQMGKIWNNRVENGLKIEIFNPFSQMITGTSLYFNKSISNMYTRLDLTSLNLTSFTIDIYLRPDAWGSYAFGDWWTDGKNGAFYGFSSNNFMFNNYFTTKSTNITSNVEGKKTHRCITHDKTETSVFLEGEKLNATPSRNSTDFLQRFAISNMNSGMSHFSGEVYSIKIYNRALTDEEIKQNYLYEQSIERE